MRLRDTPIAHLRRLVRLDADTGRIFWVARTPDLFQDGKGPRATAEVKARAWNRRFADKEAFTSRNEKGYATSTLMGGTVTGHIVAFALANGRWPAGDVDHIDGDRTNNRPGNLRDVPRRINCRNKPRYRNNTTGTVGVYQVASGRWVAHIRVDYRLKRIGTFDTQEQAAQARRAAEVADGFHDNHGRLA